MSTGLFRSPMTRLLADDANATNRPSGVITRPAEVGVQHTILVAADGLPLTVVTGIAWLSGAGGVLPQDIRDRSLKTCLGEPRRSGACGRSNRNVQSMTVRGRPRRRLVSLAAGASLRTITTRFVYSCDNAMSRRPPRKTGGQGRRTCRDQLREEANRSARTAVVVAEETLQAWRLLRAVVGGGASC